MSDTEIPAIRPADETADIEAARALMFDYARSLDFAVCFRSFDRELAGLPGPYAPPSGTLLLATLGSEPVGVVGLIRHADGIGEIRRLYVRPDARRHGLGRRLGLAALAAARTAGYHTAVLETLPSMAAAITLYRSLGFTEKPSDPGANADGILVLHRTL